MLRQSCEIPELPFTNRGPEIEAVEAFCNAPSSGASVLYIQAQSGVGKSRFLKEMSERIAESDWAVLVVTPRTHADPLRDLMGIMSQEIMRVISAWNFREVGTVLKQRLERLRRGFSKIVASGAKIVPIAGDVVSTGVDEVAGNALKPAVLEARWHAIRELAEIAREISKRQRLLIIVDDLHKFDGRELDDLARFLSVLDLSEGRDIRVIVASQPRSSVNPNFDSWVNNVNRAGLLASMEFGALASSNLRTIAAATIDNPKEAEPLIAIASGNPQVFLEQLLKLNAAGDLSTNGRFLVLPDNTIANDTLSRSLWDTIAGNGVRRRLLAVIALGRAPFSLDDLERCYEKLGAPSALELQQLASELEREGVLSWLEDDNTNSRFVLRYEHDLTRQQVRSAILNGAVGERLEFAKIAAAVVAMQLEPYTDDPVSFLKNASDLNIARPNTDALSLELFSDLCDVLSLSASPDHIPASLGLIRLADEAERPDITAQTGRDILERLPDLIAPNSIAYRQYLERILGAQYRMGWFSQVVENGGDFTMISPSVAYHVGASMLVLKDKSGDTRNVVMLTKAASDHFNDDDWNPQIELLHSLALQESGSLREANQYYVDVSVGRPEAATLSRGWIVFDLASTLFLSREKALHATRTAATKADQSGDQRLLGLALNNLGICQLHMGDMTNARAHFVSAEEALETSFAHEAVFPQNNLAGLDLLEEKYSVARTRLHSAMFRTQSDNYSTTLRINLALARFLAGYGFDEEAFRSISGRADIADNTFLKWLIFCAHSFLKVRSANEGERVDLLKRLQSEMDQHHEIGLSRVYWNRLVHDVCGDKDLEKLIVEEKPTDQPTSGVDSLSSLMRPAFMAFGRA